MSITDQLLDSLSSFTSCPKEIAFVFGSTPISPKEIYRLQLTCGAVKEETPKKQRDNLVRKIIRQMVTSEHSDLLNKETGINVLFRLIVGPTKIFVMIQESRGKDISGFLPKQTFRLKHPKRGHSLTLILGPPRGSTDDDLIWYQFGIPLQGIQSTANQDFEL